MEYTSSRIIKNTIWLYVRICIAMIVALWCTRLVLNSLGATDYGIFSIVGGAIGMLDFLNLSMSDSTMRFMSYSHGEGNIEKCKEIFNISMFFHLYTSFILMLVLFISGFFLFEYILNIPQNRLFAAKIIYSCLILSAGFHVISVPCEAVLNAHENMKFFAIVGIVDSFLKLSVAFLTISCSYDKLIVYGSLMACIPLVIFFLTYGYCRAKYEECRAIFVRKWDKGVSKEMMKFAGWNFIGTSVMMLCNQGLKLVVNMFFGVLLNAALNLAQQVDAALKMLSGNLLKAINPVITKSAGRHDTQQMMTYVYSSTKFSFFLFSILVIPFFIEASYILKLWLKDVPEWTILFCRLQLITSLFGQLGATLLTALNADGNNKSQSLSTAVIYGSSIGLTFLFFSLHLPPWSMYVSIILLNAISYRVSQVIILKTRKLMKIAEYVKLVLIPCTAILSLSFAIALLPHSMLNSSFLRLGCVAIVSTIVFVLSLFAFGMTRLEKQTVLRILRSGLK